MNYVKSKTILLFTFLIMANPLNCGNTSEIENPMITGALYTSDSRPAMGATVIIRPKNSIADTSMVKNKFINTDTVETDKNGVFSFTKLNNGFYIIEASDKNSNMLLIDSLKEISSDSRLVLSPDTLRPAGTIKGVLRLTEGGNPKKIFILAYGLDRFVTPDSLGQFYFPRLAQGTYHLEIIPQLNDYNVLDIPAITVKTEDTTDLGVLEPKFTGIPTPKNLIVTYDTLYQKVKLSWSKVDSFLIDGYNIYRSVNNQNFVGITLTPLSINTTEFIDSTIVVGSMYEYRVVSRRLSGQESSMLDLVNDTVRAVSSSLVTTKFVWNVNNVLKDTASINDTVQICLNLSNPTRRIIEHSWFIDSSNVPVKKQKDSSFITNDTLAYAWTNSGTHTVMVMAQDISGTIWSERYKITIVMDSPVALINGNGTVSINTALTMTAFVSQKFGKIVKYRWDDGIAAGFDDSTGPNFTTKYLSDKKYIIKLEVIDDDGNVGQAQKEITVTNDAPVITGLKDTSVNIEDTIQFNIKANDSNGIIQRYYWRITDDGIVHHDTTDMPSARYLFTSAAEVCSVSVAVADSFNKVGISKALVKMGTELIFPNTKTIAVGSQPQRMVFDGTGMWVTNYGSNTISRVDAVTGEIISTYQTGANPNGMISDGTNMWITLTGSNTVEKFNISTGQKVGTFEMPNSYQPVNLAYDGQNVWIGIYNSNVVVKMRGSDGTIIGAYPTGGDQVVGMAFDGTHIWAANQKSKSVAKIKADDGTLIGTYPVPSNSHSIIFDGTYIWLTLNGNNTVLKIKPDDAIVVGTYACGKSPSELCFDGKCIWISNVWGNSVLKLRASDGARLGTISNLVRPRGITYDGKHIWIVDENANKVIRY
jgi:hypothetical protein